MSIEDEVTRFAEFCRDVMGFEIAYHEREMYKAVLYEAEINRFITDRLKMSPTVWFCGLPERTQNWVKRQYLKEVTP